MGILVFQLKNKEGVYNDCLALLRFNDTLFCNHNLWQRQIMKKKLPFLFAITFLLPAACLAAYIIELENNAQFTTHHYWEKGNLIYFHAYGGIVGFRKDFIKRIQESDRPPVDDTNRLPKAKRWICRSRFARLTKSRRLGAHT